MNQTFKFILKRTTNIKKPKTDLPSCPSCETKNWLKFDKGWCCQYNHQHSNPIKLGKQMKHLIY